MRKIIIAWLSAWALITSGVFAISQGVTVNPPLGLSSASGEFTCTSAGVCTVTKANGNTITAGTGTLTLGSVTLNAGAGGTLGSNAFTSTAYAPLASPTFTGTVTIPNGGVFGTPTSMTATNITGTAPGLTAGNVTGLTTNGTAAVGQLPGTTTNDAAAAGKVGEILTDSATTVSLANITAKTVISKALTAGDWDVWCSITFTPAGTTTMEQFIVELSPTVDSVPTTLGNYTRFSYQALTAAGGQVSSFNSPSVPISTTGATFYCNAFSQFAISTMTADGKITARRRR